jgi:hypothetical protein
MMFLSIIIFFLHVFVVYVDEIHVEMQTNVYISDNLFKYNNKCLIFLSEQDTANVYFLCVNSHIYIIENHLKLDWIDRRYCSQ